VKRLGAVRKLVARFLNGEEVGLSVVEYGLLLGLVATVCITAITLFGSRINEVCSTLAGSL
jgi:Flp pilus assembly pilin Flp